MFSEWHQLSPSQGDIRFSRSLSVVTSKSPTYYFNFPSNISPYPSSNPATSLHLQNSSSAELQYNSSQSPHLQVNVPKPSSLILSDPSPGAARRASRTLLKYLLNSTGDSGYWFGGEGWNVQKIVPIIWYLLHRSLFVRDYFCWVSHASNSCVTFIRQPLLWSLSSRVIYMSHIYHIRFPRCRK